MYIILYDTIYTIYINKLIWQVCNALYECYTLIEFNDVLEKNCNLKAL